MSRLIRLLALVAAALAGSALATAAPSLADGTQQPPAAQDTTTAATTTATTTGRATPESTTAARRAAQVERIFPAAGQLLVSSVPARAHPSPRARVIKVMKQFRDDYRPQEVFAVKAQPGTDGRPWYEISVPMRPNGTMGWIPARTVSLDPTVSEIDVHRNPRTIDIYWHGRHVWHGRVAIGAPGMPTPLGHYYVAARFVPYQDPFLGVFAVETSGYSSLTEWPGGGWFGIHGTDEPWLLGRAVSHGCVRVANATALQLRRYAPLGTPIVITDA
jgi:lipoprotein-anchoring transpeptidase ErfK/SrfK